MPIGMPYTFGTINKIKYVIAITKEIRMIAFNACDTLFFCIGGRQLNCVNAVR